MLERVRTIISEQFEIDIDRITEETNLKDDLGADSVDLVELAMTLEDEFGLAEPQQGDELPDFSTVSDVVKYLEQLLN